ncbi:hypothetical protein F4859DRAFT_508802 [Xylaria cf. heliscus]|nr:hypothetical protein F4859DRAFT_508802 [Xylaria cf. heliscus]
MVNFNTKIVTVNLTNQLELQRNWAWDPEGCVRPNTEFEIPILCQVQRHDNGTALSSLGVEYDTFKQLAMNFDECIYNAASDKLKSYNASDTTNNPYRGRCEWINYDSLKKGIREPEDITNAAPTQRLLSWVLVATMLTATVIGPLVL